MIVRPTCPTSHPPLASPGTLREWCRLSCDRYPDVHIGDMSSSFRDGLAFCALIHQHRPDLIDFSSLSKDDVYQNNKLAFEVAESRLGVPALLDPAEMVSSQVPDRLGVTTYLSQMYCVLYGKSRAAGSAGFGSPHVAVLSSRAKTGRSSDGVKPLKRAPRPEENDALSRGRPRTVCHLCLKPVHLVQRHLVEGKVFHRSCFRCKVCHSTLLPGSYARGADAGSLICSDHTTDLAGPHVDLSPQLGPAQNRPQCSVGPDHSPCYYSFGGLPIAGVPRYTTASQERPVRAMPETDGGERRETPRSASRKPRAPAPPSPGDAGGARGGQGRDGPTTVPEDGQKRQEDGQKRQEDTKNPQSSSGDGGTGGSGGRVENDSEVPVPAPRKRPPLKTQRSTAAGASSNQGSLSQGASPIPRTNHPWMTIIHPGPWTQLPPAPVPTPRSKFLFGSRRTWIKPQGPAPNPFDEHLDESDGSPVRTSGDRDVCSGGSENVAEQNLKPSVDGAAASDPAEGASAPYIAAEIQSIHPALLDKDEATVSDEGRHSKEERDEEEEENPFLPKSVSVPVFASVPPHGAPTEATGSVALRNSKPVPRENPFDRKPSMPRSKTFHGLLSGRAAAPGHGFPLIKRKVQADPHLSAEDLRTEMEGVNERLEALQERGVQMENDLRECKDAHAEEQMLMDWFSLLHERQLLTRRDTELVYMMKQQRLEERQADVEYELRCLLNKPENDWSEEERGREQQLMDELVAVIEQRNQIIGSLDQDRQREKGEDGLSEDFRTNKEFQREGLKELKKLKGKFKPTNVFKILNNKAESLRCSVDKKS